MITQWAKMLLMGKYTGPTGVEYGTNPSSVIYNFNLIKDVNGNLFAPQLRSAITSMDYGTSVYSKLKRPDIIRMFEQQQDDFWGCQGFEFDLTNIDITKKSILWGKPPIRVGSESYPSMSNNTTVITPIKFVFGAGITAVSIKDYTLAEPITEGIKVNTVSISQAIEDEKLKTFYTLTGYAITAITLTEVGMIKTIGSVADYNKAGKIIFSEEDDSTDLRNVLLAREVLPKPLELLEGDYFTIVMEVNI